MCINCVVNLACIVKTAHKTIAFNVILGESIITTDFKSWQVSLCFCNCLDYEILSNTCTENTCSTVAIALIIFRQSKSMAFCGSNSAKT